MSLELALGRYFYTLEKEGVLYGFYKDEKESKAEAIKSKFDNDDHADEIYTFWNESIADVKVEDRNKIVDEHLANVARAEEINELLKDDKVLEHLKELVG